MGTYTFLLDFFAGLMFALATMDEIIASSGLIVTTAPITAPTITVSTAVPTAGAVVAPASTLTPVDAIATIDILGSDLD